MSHTCVFVKSFIVGNLQGSVAGGGAAVAWLRDNIGIIQSLTDIG